MLWTQTYAEPFGLHPATPHHSPLHRSVSQHRTSLYVPGAALMESQRAVVPEARCVEPMAVNFTHLSVGSPAICTFTSFPPGALT
mmetsp:Transcript_32851/g.88996  ORF Transcript_32851/g.88996 Transcript_32851/m.88996 type:complete len:85 (-) Transcript_32851:577-831(-)